MDFSCLPILVPKPQQCPLLPSPFIFCQKAARTLLTTSFSLTLETHYPLFLLTVLSDQDFSPFPPQLFLSATVTALLSPAFAPSEQRMAFYHLNAEPFQSFEHWLHPNTSFVFKKKKDEKKFSRCLLGTLCHQNWQRGKIATIPQFASRGWRKYMNPVWGPEPFWLIKLIKFN